MQNETLTNQGSYSLKRVCSPPDFTREGNAWDSLLACLAFLATGSYLLFYVLVPNAYVAGPAILLLLSLFGFRWKTLLGNIDRQSQWFIGALSLFFLGQVIPLVFHGEDISEFDLSTRYIASIFVLVFLLKYSLSARWFFLLVATGALMTGAYAFYQVEFEGMLRVSAFDNPIHYGNGAMALALLALAGVVWASRQGYRLFWVLLLLIGFVGGIYASLMSGTRSGWIAAPVVVFTGLYVFWRPLSQRKGLSLFLLVMVVAGFVVLSQVDLVERRAEIAVDEFVDYYEEGRNGTSVGLRLDMWKAGLAAFRHNPLMGAGPAGTDAFIDDLIAAGDIHPAVRDFRHLHNQYVDVMARYGAIGLVGYLLLLAVPFGLFLKKSRSDIVSVRALGLAGCFFIGLHAVVNLTQSMLERNIGVMMFVFMVIIIWGVLRSEEERHRIKSSETVSSDRQECACDT